MDEKTNRLSRNILFPDQLACLLSDPDRIGVGCSTCQMNASDPQLDEEQHIDGLQPDGFHTEEIASQDLILVVTQEVEPGIR